MARVASVGLVLMSVGCAAPHKMEQGSQGRSPSGEPGPLTIVAASEVDWRRLNPARGNKSPMAGTLWGDRGADVPTGYLIQFKDGFASPPHIHNVTYRGVVLGGLVHNDDPGADRMWMPPGSFWTQPKGEVHITAAEGVDSMAYIEIDAGPYLVLPIEDAFATPERPINVDPGNLVWVDASVLEGDAEGARGETGGAEAVFLWGTVEPGFQRGAFLRLPPGFTGHLEISGQGFRAIVTTGSALLHNASPRVDAPSSPQLDEPLLLEVGSYLGSDGPRHLACSVPGDRPAVLYLHTRDAVRVVAYR